MSTRKSLILKGSLFHTSVFKVMRDNCIIALYFHNNFSHPLDKKVSEIFLSWPAVSA